MKFIICDVDNVLSDDSWRLSFINRAESDLLKRYHDYHVACLLDAAHNRGLVAVHGHARVLLFTSMPERYAPLREAWLRHNGFHHDLILYRRNDDHRPSAEVKLDMLTRAAKLGFEMRNALVAYDDRPDVVAAYAAAGLKAERVFIYEGA